MSKMTEFRQALRVSNWHAAEVFLRASPDLLCRVDAKGRSLASYATQDGRWAEVRWLLNHGASIDQVVSGRFFSLEIGAPTDIASRVEQRLGEVDPPSVEGGRLLSACVEAGNRSLTKKMLEKRLLIDRPDWHPSWLACMKNFDEEIAQSLLISAPAGLLAEIMPQLGASSLSARSLTALDWLAYHGLDVDAMVEQERLLGVAVKVRFAAGLQALLSNGAAADAKDIRGRTALYLCVAKGYEDGAKILLAAGADPECRQGHRSQGDSPIRLAGKAGSRGIRKLLMPGFEEVVLNRSILVGPAYVEGKKARL